MKRKADLVVSFDSFAAFLPEATRRFPRAFVAEGVAPRSARRRREARGSFLSLEAAFFCPASGPPNR